MIDALTIQGRFLRLLETLVLPAGVTVEIINPWMAAVNVPWSPPWLPHGGVDEATMLRRSLTWSPETLAATGADDDELARLVVQEVAAAVMLAIGHEFVEASSLRGEKLWEAHPLPAPGEMTLSLSMTPHILSRLTGGLLAGLPAGA